MPPNNELTLEDVISRLKQNQRVEGVLQIGSLTTDTFSSDSDYDIVIVLRDAPHDWYVGVTAIAQRFTDLLFVDLKAIEKLINSKQTTISLTAPLEPIVRWLQKGTIVFDRNALLQRAQAQIKHQFVIDMPSDDDARGSWFAINYNIAQTSRMLRSANPLYRQTAEVRMAVYGYSDVWHGYFTINKRQWKGEKEAISQLRRCDPVFLLLYERFVKETNADRKFKYYVHAASVATERLGGLWPENATVLQDQTALSWQELIDAPDIPFLWRVQIWQDKLANIEADSFADNFANDNALYADGIMGYQSVMSILASIDNGGLFAQSINGFGDLFLEFNAIDARLTYKAQSRDTILLPKLVNQPIAPKINCRYCVGDEIFLANSGIYRAGALALLQTILRTGKLPSIVEPFSHQPMLPGFDEMTAVDPDRFIVEWHEE